MSGTVDGVYGTMGVGDVVLWASSGISSIGGAMCVSIEMADACFGHCCWNCWCEGASGMLHRRRDSDMIRWLGVRGR